MSEYRFFVNEHDGNGEPTIYRAKTVKLADDSGDSWRHYWDGDGIVAFIEGYRNGVTSVTSNDETNRAVDAYAAAKNYSSHRPTVEGALKRVAQRITGNWDADFICVGLDRGYDLYALAWGGDPDRKWAYEIEALHHGDVWRFEAQEYNVFTESWDESDEWDTYYGEADMMSEFLRQYPLDAFPAHLVVQEVGA